MNCFLGRSRFSARLSVPENDGPTPRPGPGNLLREFVGLIGEQQSETQNENFLEI